jgi:hypothetical protein
VKAVLCKTLSKQYGDDLAEELKDGVDLTTLLLQVDPSAKIKPSKTSKLEFKQLENVQAFIDGKR